MSENTDLNIMRRMAEMEISTVIALRSMALEQHTSAFKWLLASLLTVNGGGAITVAQSALIEGQSRVLACAFFLVGIGLSLTSSFLSQRLNVAGLPALQKQLGFWATVAETGNFDAEEFDVFKADFQRATKWGWWVPAFGWFSAMAFVAGAIVVGFSLSHASTSQVRSLHDERSSPGVRHNDARTD